MEQQKDRRLNEVETRELELRDHIEKYDLTLLDGLETLQLNSSGVAHLLGIDSRTVTSWKAGEVIPALYQLQLYMFLDAANQLWMKHVGEEEDDVEEDESQAMLTNVHLVMILLEQFSDKLDTFSNAQKQAATSELYQRVKNHPKQSLRYLIGDAHRISLEQLVATQTLH